MEENKIPCKTTYKCALCGQTYQTVEERAACEADCIHDRREAERVKRQNEYQAQKDASAAKIEEKMNELNSMIQVHMSKYNTLTVTKPYYFLTYVLKKPFLWV